MHNKLGIRALALVLAMVMVLGLTPAASAIPAGASHLGAYKTIADYLEAQKTTFDQIAPETEVEFIVELEAAPHACKHYDWRCFGVSKIKMKTDENYKCNNMGPQTSRNCWR